MGNAGDGVPSCRRAHEAGGGKNGRRFPRSYPPQDFYLKTCRGLPVIWWLISIGLLAAAAGMYVIARER